MQVQADLEHLWHDENLRRPELLGHDEVQRGLQCDDGAAAPEVLHRDLDAPTVLFLSANRLTSLTTKAGCHRTGY